MTAKNVATNQEKGKKDLLADTTQRMTLTPPVDIVEDADGISLTADLPGVSKDGLGVRVDSNTLTIEGEAKFDVPAELESLYAEIRSVRYQRSFTLSRELDADKIDAELKNGVLKLRIPKHEKSKPRRIEVKTV